MNVPIILKFSTRRAEALNVKELVRQTGIVVTLSRDNENCSPRQEQQRPGKQAQHDSFVLFCSACSLNCRGQFINGVCVIE